MNEILSMNSKSLFKLLLFCYTGFYIPIGILTGLLAALEIMPANLNDEQYVGVKGFTINILFIPFMIIILTTCTWIVLAPGLKLAKTCVFLFYKVQKK
ncbi:hypothetical protein I5M27_03980 [Adhaeribacter sp. BT258]|uniref:Uncharacterized protein n=1 Tax=Adhaeribacter terrigena TaxID=2793070 RepID=A0ABS1BYE4_9BACT|nr:hypothetical protein [Adhaeribacter terrigena]MBK0402129.1 hypothetical protein [Adhaeribacter terrigena]